MAVTDVTEQTAQGSRPRASQPRTGSPRDLQRTFLLLLATVWLLDAVLQIQPFMFTAGDSGFSGMLSSLAAGNPNFVAHSVTWNASIVDHHAVLTNTVFALIQFAIAFGIVWKRTCKAALGLSIVWSLGVWWFGEGAGGIFLGTATPLGGGPGGVLFYAVLAVLLWPSEGSDSPFVAARTIGVNAAKAVWVGVWAILALLAVVGSGRSPQSLHALVVGLEDGQPGWLVHIDKVSSSFLLHHGTAAAILFAVVSLLIAAAPFLPQPFWRAGVVVAIAMFAVIWVAVQNVGGILAGGATDPNSGLVVMLLAAAFWPIHDDRQGPNQLHAPISAQEGR